MRNSNKSIIALFLILGCISACNTGNNKDVTNGSTAATAETVFSADEGGSVVNAGGGPLQWPLDNSFGAPLREVLPMTNNFLHQRSTGDYHLGLDLAATEYSDVLAVGDGQIVLSTFRPGTGNWGGIIILQITQPQPFFVIYGHVDDASRPALNTTVSKGSVIAKIEKSGTHTWPTHLHFQIGTGLYSRFSSVWLSPPGYAVTVDTALWKDPIPYLSQFKISTAVQEIANGIDDDANGLIDDCASCWIAIYRFRDPNTGARMWNNITTPPAAYSGYVYEIEAWVAATNPIPNTFHVVQCSKLTDHILVEKNSADYQALINAGYTQTADLGYAWRLNAVDRSKKYLGTNYNVCPVYRFSYSANGLGAHLFTRGADNLTGMTCESPARFEIITTHECFSAPPCN